jgi:hypothetical protein
LMRWRRILRTCWGLVMTARTRIWEPQRVQRKGSTSYTFASSRAQAERDSVADTDRFGVSWEAVPRRRAGCPWWSFCHPSGASRARWGWRDHVPREREEYKP